MAVLRGRHEDYRVYREAIEGGTPELIKASRMKNRFVGAPEIFRGREIIGGDGDADDPVTEADLHALALIDVAADTESSMRIFPSQPTITFPVAFAPETGRIWRMRD